MLHGKRDVVMIHLQLASLMDPMNIVAADSEERKI